MATGGVVMQRGAVVVAASPKRSSSSSSSSRSKMAMYHSSNANTATSNLADEAPILDIVDLDIIDADSGSDTDTDTGGRSDSDDHKKKQRQRKRRRRKNSRPFLVLSLSRLYHLTMNHMIVYAAAASSRYQHRRRRRQQQQQQQQRLGSSSSSSSNRKSMEKKTVKRITTILGMSLFMGLFVVLSSTSQQLHRQIRRQQTEASISSSSSSSSLLTTTAAGMGQDGVEYDPTDNGWSTSLTRTGMVATILGSSSFDAVIPRILTSIYSSGTSSSDRSSRRNLLRKSSPSSSSETLSSSTTRATSTTSTSSSSSESSFYSSRTFFNRRRLNKRFNSNSNSNSKSKNRSYIDERGLRYLALGGQAFVAMGESSTSSSDHNNGNSDGNGKKNNKGESYPALLSQNVRTVSAAGGDEIVDDDDDDDDDNPTLASLCTQSMIGDENIYDVITLQYHTTRDGVSSSSSSSTTSAVGLLLERLRQRFPDSTIVFVDIWSPLEAYYYDDDEQRPTGKVSFEQWRSKILQEDDDSSSILLSKHLKDHEWLFDDDEDDARRTEIEGIVEAIGGILYRLPRSSINDSDSSSSHGISQTIMDWFVEHPTTNIINSDNGDDENADGMMEYSLSPKAHAFIASDLESIIKRSIEMTPAYTKARSSTVTAAIAASTTTGDGSPSSPRVGTWGSGDSCQLWYEAGSAIPSQFSQGLSFVELAAPSFDSKRGSNNKGSSRRALSSSSSSSEPIRSQRYALEVTSTSNEIQDGNDAFSSSFLEVQNPFDEDRMLYLTYLTTSATSSSRKVYPRTKIQLRHGASSIASGMVVLDPSHDDNSDVHHHTRTSAIGTVPGGQSSTIYFTPLEEYTESSFRVVGASFLAKEKLSHRISSDYHLSPHGITMKFDDTQDDDETQN